MQTKSLFNLSFAMVILMGVNACQSSDDEVVLLHVQLRQMM